MKLKARLVLEDAKEASKELPEYGGQTSPDNSTVRRRWIAVMALLRAVGHVLHKVDGNTNEFLRKAVNEKWQDRPIIFTEFIEKYRNAVLKRYEHPDISYEMIMGTLYPSYDVTIGDGSPIPINIAVSDAIQFWEDYLDDIEQLAIKYKNED